MKIVLQNQLKEMSDNELEEILRRDYLRRLVRYRMINDFYEKKYTMDFQSFEKSNIVEKHNYSFEVESNAQQWELAIDGISTVERKMRELAGEN